MKLTRNKLYNKGCRNKQYLLFFLKIKTKNSFQPINQLFYSIFAKKNTPTSCQILNDYFLFNRLNRVKTISSPSWLPTCRSPFSISQPPSPLIFCLFFFSTSIHSSSAPFSPPKAPEVTLSNTRWVARAVFLKKLTHFPGRVSFPQQNTHYEERNGSKYLVECFLI